LNVYPESKYVAECNTYLDNLRAKLSLKAYRTAKLYFNMGEYKSAIVALKNSANDFPEMAQKEELDFLVVKANFLLAKNSVEYKQKERFENTLAAFEEFAEQYPESSKYMREAKEIKQKAINSLKSIEQQQLNNSTI
jgi:outer membrane protein assembly factor BamD